MQVVIDDKIVRYDDYNLRGAPTILLIHGWGDTASGLSSLAHHLAMSYRVVVPDLPGFGGSARPDDPWGLREYAVFIEKFLTKINVQQKAIIGHSNGGAIAIRGLASGILQTDKLVLLASAGVRSEYKGRKKLFRVAAKTAKVATVAVPPKARLKLKKSAYKTIGSDMFVAEDMQESFKSIISDDVQADAAKIRVPTLLLYGDTDSATPVAYGEKFANIIPEAKLLIIPQAGHFVHIDAEETVLSSIKDFIS